MNFTFAIVLLAFSFCVFSAYTLFTILYRKGGQQSKIPDKNFPYVSILKPLKNVDDDIENNLESLFLLDYPRFEILFGVDKMQDPIVEIISSLCKKYPHIKTQIMATGHSDTENPKIHKLAMMAPKAHGSLYWVSDSNIRAEKDTLNKLASEYLTKGSKVIFSPIRGTGSNSLGSIIENAYINHFLSGNVIFAWRLFKQQIIVGKSILIEKETLDRFGGFSYFKNHLAEDYKIGTTYTQSKFPISTNFTWVTNVNRTTTVKAFFSRMERWAKLRYHLRKPVYILEVLLNPVMLAVIFAVLVGGKQGLLILATGFSLKILLEYLNFFFINTEDRSKLRVLLALPFCVLLKDFLLFIVYFTPFFSNTVNWRGGKISIGKETLIAFSNENLLYEGA